MIEGTWPTTYSYKILPAVYDEAWSYWQQINHLCKKMNELVTYVNGITGQWQTGDAQTLQQAKDYADLVTSTLNGEFQNYVNQIEKMIVEFKTENENFQTEIQTEIENNLLDMKQLVYEETAGLHENVTALWLAMNYLFYQQDASFQKLGAALKSYIEESTAYMTGARITVKNPVKGSITTLNAALLDLMNYIGTIGSITMRQYDSLKITMEDYDGMQITALEYALRAYFIFFKQLELMDYMASVDKQFDGISGQLKAVQNALMVYNPYTGKISPFQDVLNAHTGFLSGAPTKREYGAFTQNFNLFTTYNNLKITMEEYRRHGAGKYLEQQVAERPGITYNKFLYKADIHGETGTLYLEMEIPQLSTVFTETSDGQIHYYEGLFAYLAENYFKGDILEFGNLSVSASTGAYSGSGFFYGNINTKTIDLCLKASRIVPSMDIQLTPTFHLLLQFPIANRFQKEETA